MAPVVFANRYQALDKLGQGAMGVVYLVDDPIAERMAAMKVISGEIDRNERQVLQFKQEFRLMTQLRHPNCCEVYDYGQLENGEPYFTMEVVPGRGLDECLPLDQETFRQVFAQLMLALGYVHQQGFVHRDLKSMNVRLKPNGTVKLMDFGLMSYVGQSHSGISGTVAYIAPEIVKRGPVDPRSDLYAAGVLAYELLTGKMPFERATPMEVLRAHVNDRPEPLYRLVPDIEPALERIVLKLLEKEPLARYQSAQHVLEDLGVEAPPGLGGSLLTSPLVGRERELADLTTRLERVAQGAHEPAIVLHGPPGIGKSRLVDAFRFAAQLELLPCAVGRPTEQEHTPYGPFIMILRTLLPEFAAHAPDVLERHAPVLVKLLPELRVTPAADMDHPNKEKMRLQTAIAESLLALAARRPLALVLEDWHWADALSRDFLDYWLRNAQNVAILVLVTTREAEEDSPLTGRVHSLPLQPLARPDLHRMVASMLGTPEIDPLFLEQLAALSEGSPLYLERLLDHLVKNGVLARRQGAWDMDIEIPPDAALHNLTALLADRLSLLPSYALLLAQAAAVHGTDFHLELMKRVTGFGDDELFDALAMLERQRIVVQSEPGLYRFAQDLVQNLLYTQLDEPARKRLHSRIASALEHELWDKPLPMVPFDLITAIADHCLLSETPESAITYALEAGRRAAGLFATAEARRFLTAGLALVEADGSPVWAPIKLSYLQQLADLDRLTNVGETARERYQAAIALAETLRAREILGRLLTSLAKVQQIMNDLPGALASCERALEVHLAAGDLAGAARCLDTSGRIRYFSGDATGAIAECEQAIAYATRAEAIVIQANTLGFLGYLLVASVPERLEEGLQHLKSSIFALTEVYDLYGLNNVLQLAGSAHMTLGDLSEAQICFHQARAISERVGNRTEAMFTLINLGQVTLEQGDFEGTLAITEEVREMAMSFGGHYPEGLALILAAAATVQLGPIEAARAHLDTALGYARELKHRFLETLVTQFQMEVALRLGDLDDAHEKAQALRALIVETGFTDPEGRLALTLAWVEARHGRPDAARAELERGRANPKFQRNRLLVLEAHKLEAWLALTESDFETASRLASEGLTLALALDARYQAARFEGLLGVVALARGEDASAHFAAMAAAAETLHVPLLLAEARFGQAAANAHAPEAPALAEEARRHLETALSGASADTRRVYLSLQERRRILDGDYLAFARPLAKHADAAAARNQSLGGGMWTMM